MVAPIADAYYKSDCPGTYKDFADIRSQPEGQNYLVWLCRKENKSEECQVDLINAVKQPDADLSSYDPIFESCKVTKRLQTQ